MGSGQGRMINISLPEDALKNPNTLRALELVGPTLTEPQRHNWDSRDQKPIARDTRRRRPGSDAAGHELALESPAGEPPCVAGAVFYGGRAGVHQVSRTRRGRSAALVISWRALFARSVLEDQGCHDPSCILTRMASDHSAIEWTESTWNPTSGCTKVSPGCDRCYAERVTQRFPTSFPNGFLLSLRPDALTIPLRWKRARTIFVNSMSDLFHADVPEDYLVRVFEVMQQTPQHTYQVLTKRAERLARTAPRLPWPDNVWVGVSIETLAFTWRIDYLRRVPASVRFISAEPLLAALPELNLAGIQWLIAGGESQPGCRPAETDWFRDLRDQCDSAGVAFFLKQLGGHPSKRGGTDALLDGQRHTAMPHVPKRACLDGVSSSRRPSARNRVPDRALTRRAVDTTPRRFAIASAR